MRIYLTLLLPWTAVSAAPPPALGFDSVIKEVYVAPAETKAIVTFTLTNRMKRTVTITRIKTSCGCTAIGAPNLPWRIPSNSGGNVSFTTDVKGKTGQLNKSAAFQTSEGPRFVTFAIHVPQAMDTAARQRNLGRAEENRQAVFKGTCADCHSHPTRNRKGSELFSAACGICHESEHRAEMIPALRTSTPTRSAEAWEQLISEGKPNTLMPAFLQQHGGPLTGDQVQSLVDYLLSEFPTR